VAGMMAADWRWRAARGVIVVLALVAGACGDDGEDDTGQEDEAANTTVAAANTTTSAAANTTASAETDEKLNACMDQHEMRQAETVWRMRDGLRRITSAAPGDVWRRRIRTATPR
jgi:hypothetical protein